MNRTTYSVQVKKLSKEVLEETIERAVHQINDNKVDNASKNVLNEIFHICKNELNNRSVKQEA